MTAWPGRVRAEVANRSQVAGGGERKIFSDERRIQGPPGVGHAGRQNAAGKKRTIIVKENHGLKELKRTKKKEEKNS
jgi:hypothetical protein